ncbi:hypothetical protein HK101_007616 [Irineochytrium annulatum]|nr:hypothetical protein HK101_007616 [Irineochytrium annulatum]
MQQTGYHQHEFAGRPAYRESGFADEKKGAAGEIGGGAALGVRGSGSKRRWIIAGAAFLGLVIVVSVAVGVAVAAKKNQVTTVDNSNSTSSQQQQQAPAFIAVTEVDPAFVNPDGQDAPSPSVAAAAAPSPSAEPAPVVPLAGSDSGLTTATSTFMPASTNATTAVPTMSLVAPPPPPPVGGKFLIGGWWDQIMPKDINSKMSGYNSAVPAGSLWQTTKSLSDGGSFDAKWDIQQVEATNTDAAFQVVIFPKFGVSDAAIDKMVAQVDKIASSGRLVFLRYGSEMNGYWFMDYSLQPSKFVAEWRRVAQRVYAGVSQRQNVAMLWSPMVNANPGWAPDHCNSEMDTNGDGKCNMDDDPYTPYYPGDDVVDWVGISIYAYGDRESNKKPDPNLFLNKLHDSQHDSNRKNYFDFYDMFCNKRGKPMMLSECRTCIYIMNSAPFLRDVDSGDGNLAIKQGWWRQFLNADVLKSHPMLLGANFFDLEKPENGHDNDFRVYADNDGVAAALADDLGSIATFLRVPNSGKFSSGL